MSVWSGFGQYLVRSGVELQCMARSSSVLQLGPLSAAFDIASAWACMYLPCLMSTFEPQIFIRDKDWHGSVLEGGVQHPVLLFACGVSTALWS